MVVVQEARVDLGLGAEHLEHRHQVQQQLPHITNEYVAENQLSRARIARRRDSADAAP